MAKVSFAAQGLYLPIELFELVHQVTALRTALLLANLVVVAVMLRALLQRRKARAQHAA